jgi:hypothetical protein
MLPPKPHEMVIRRSMEAFGHESHLHNGRKRAELKRQTVLKQITPATVTAIIRNGTTGQQPTHKSGKAHFRATQKNVRMIGHQRPGTHGSFRSGSQLSQTLHKIFTIGNGVDNPALFGSSHNYIMQGPRGIQSSTTRHHIPPTLIVSQLTSHKLVFPVNAVPLFPIYW